MAYAALLSLVQILEKVLHSTQHSYVLDVKPKLVSLHESVRIIQRFLDNHSQSETVDQLEIRIRDAAYRAQDVIESQEKFPIVEQEFQNVLEEMEIILEEVKKIGNKHPKQDRNELIDCHSSDPPSSSSIKTRGEKNKLVGFEDDLMAIKSRLYEEASNLRTISIVGMGGIGKTTLARRVYEDSIRSQYFDRCVWIFVSQDYSLKQILLGILQSITTQQTDEMNKKHEGELAERVYKELVGRKYLIVMDDVWTTKAWDDLRRFFPNGETRSRILLTTRISDVAAYATNSFSPPHEMHFLNEEESWTLLKGKVFESQESCPSWLVDIGKMIATSCGGLPLTIVVVAGILSENKTIEYWENVSRNISSSEPNIHEHCSKVLALSYERLPSHLKPCFLYMTAFPQGFKINVRRLVRLWMAEGFLKETQTKCLEEVGEEYLDDLVRRSLVFVAEKRSNRKLKTVIIHDLLWDFCSIEADEEKFLFHLEDENAITIAKSGKNNYRRLSFRLSYRRLNRFKDLINYSTTQSLLFFKLPYDDHLLGFAVDFSVLWILDALGVSCRVFPGAITELVNLRYLAFLYDYDEPRELPSSISKLYNLQTLVILQKSSFNHYRLLRIPFHIWKLPKLRHLILAQGSYVMFSAEISEETHLQTLSKVTNFKFTEEAIKILANLKKLGLYYIVRGTWKDYDLHKVVFLQNLEELSIIRDCECYINFECPQCWPDRCPLDFDFPKSLKNLTLNDCSFHWEDMTHIGSLPNLEVLKLIGRAFAGGKWNPNEGEFLQLKYLQFSDDDLWYWGVECMHFPRLECLVLKYTGSTLKEIPPVIVDMYTLQLIELHNCWPSIVASAKRIQEEQIDMGNDPVEVRIYSSNEMPSSAEESEESGYDTC